LDRNVFDDQMIENFQILSKHPSPSIVKFDHELIGTLKPGNPVTWCAEVSNPGEDMVYFRFSLRSGSTKKNWIPKTNWMRDNRWTWIPDILDIGNCEVAVEIRRPHIEEYKCEDKSIKQYRIIGSCSDIKALRKATINNSKAQFKAVHQKTEKGGALGRERNKLDEVEVIFEGTERIIRKISRKSDQRD
jgi:hypothetical protein